ncbi:MAG: Na/Pi cotransporter family protein [Clostridia bacterium]|nr:Na/Pi cotransporter family protein [Clostridia bacterium]
MTAVDIITALLGLLAGIGVFLVSIKIISSNLESVGGNRLKALFAKTSKSNLLGVGIGTAATALVQSSGATSVMAIGFVNAGVMALTQAAAIVLGSNLGTTITGQIVAIGFLGNGTSMISASVILAALAGVGAFITYFAKRGKVKRIGSLLAGFGLLFLGLNTMSGSMKTFTGTESPIRDFIQGINFTGYEIVLVCVGILLTAVMQSSSVTSSIAITMYASGLITLNQGIFLILGSNVGAVVVALLATLGANVNAKRLALFHLITNILRVFLFVAVAMIVAYISHQQHTIGHLFEMMFPEVPAFQLSMFHTIFNAVTVLLLTPLIKPFVKLCEKMLPERVRKEEEQKAFVPRLFYIDEHLLKTPPIAMKQTNNEIVYMAEIAMRNFNLSCDIVCSLDFANIEDFRHNEEQLNFLNREIVRFIVKLSATQLTGHDHLYLSTAFHTITDLERIGDYAENIVEYAEKLKAADESFSETAVKEIRNLQQTIDELFQKVMKAYVSRDFLALAEADKIEDQIDDLTDQMSENHIQRLADGTCTPDVGAHYLSLCSNAERVADHFINVAKTIRDFAN